MTKLGDFIKYNRILLMLVFLSLLFYAVFAYDLVRSDHIKFLSLYAALFFLFYKLLKIAGNRLDWLTWIAFGSRAVFLLAIPNLSQDFYRFIWDGRLILEGINPYLYTVESFISNGDLPVAQSRELYEGMGSLNAGHFSNYPPINQLCFALAGLLAGKSILGSAMVLRILIILADLGILYFGKKLLRELRIPEKRIFWYILNPFIIIELTGNLHFEGVMIFFLVWSLYLLYQRRWSRAAVPLALSISVKLIPLIFLPLFYQWFMKRQLGTRMMKFWDLITFYGITIVVAGLTFIPFYNDSLIKNYSQTVGLWFNNFEFNASLYYVAREIGFQFRGYNGIAIIGSTIPWLVLLFVLVLSLVRLNTPMIRLIPAMLLALSAYYFTATTVHPWYIATLLLLSLFTNYRFPVFWSFMIVLSYLSYSELETRERLWIIALEYAVVYGVLIWDVIRIWKLKPAITRS